MKIITICSGTIYIFAFFLYITNKIDQLLPFILLECGTILLSLIATNKKEKIIPIEKKWNVLLRFALIVILVFVGCNLLQIAFPSFPTSGTAFAICIFISFFM